MIWSCWPSRNSSRTCLSPPPLSGVSPPQRGSQHSQISVPCHFSSKLSETLTHDTVIRQGRLLTGSPLFWRRFQLVFMFCFWNQIWNFCTLNSCTAKINDYCYYFSEKFTANTVYKWDFQHFFTMDGGLESTSHVRTAATWPERREVERLKWTRGGSKIIGGILNLFTIFLSIYWDGFNWKSWKLYVLHW